MEQRPGERGFEGPPHGAIGHIVVNIVSNVSAEENEYDGESAEQVCHSQRHIFPHRSHVS